MPKAKFTAWQYATAMSIRDMAQELGLSDSGMLRRTETQAFRAKVRMVDDRPYRRRWLRSDFRRYVRDMERIDELKTRPAH